MVSRELRHVVSVDKLTAGIVLTGGGTMLPGLVDLAEQIFDMPARLGELRGLAHVPDGLDAPSFAAGLGLLAYGFAVEPSTQPRGGKVRTWLSKIESWITKKM